MSNKARKRTRASTSAGAAGRPAPPAETLIRAAFEASNLSAMFPLKCPDDEHGARRWILHSASQLAGRYGEVYLIRAGRLPLHTPDEHPTEEDIQLQRAQIWMEVRYYNRLLWNLWRAVPRSLPEAFTHEFRGFCWCTPSGWNGTDDHLRLMLNALHETARLAQIAVLQPPPAKPLPPGVAMDAEHRTITLNAQAPVPLTLDQFRVVSRLVEARGGWINGDALRACPGSSERIDRIIRDLPEALKNRIESAPSKGYLWRM